MTEPVGVSTLERLEALVANEELYALAELVPTTDPTHGGRPRAYPVFMWLLFDALLSIHGSARKVEAELAHPLAWTYLSNLVRHRFPDDSARWLPAVPMRRHHYLYGRTNWLTRADFLDALTTFHRHAAVEQARQVGLLDPAGPGSWTHPDLSRMMYADGKVITPLFKAQQGDTKLNKHTGELLPLRYEADAGLHFEGTGETAWGTKFVLVAVRSTDIHGRIILDTRWVPTPGGEAAAAIDSFTDLAPANPGAQGVIYDTALRGKHHQRLLRDLGLLSVNRVTAHRSASKPRRKDSRRTEKSTHVEDRTVTLPEGTETTVSIFAKGGTIGIGTLTDDGTLAFAELPRVRTHRNADKIGYRWYNDYRLPEHLGGKTLTIRLHGNDDDKRRQFNRTENIRPIPPTDPDFTRLYRRRNDAESINRALDDTLWLRRDHSIGHERQQLNLLTYALVVNSLTLHQHRRHHGHPPALTQAA